LPLSLKTGARAPGKSFIPAKNRKRGNPDEPALMIFQPSSRPKTSNTQRGGEHARLIFHGPHLQPPEGITLYAFYNEKNRIRS
jgi:hypothetical protein